MDRKQELDSALKEFLSRAEMHPIHEALDLTKTGEYIFVFGMSSFSNQEDPGDYYFLAPAEVERKLTDNVYSLLSSQVSPATVRSSLQSAINIIDQNTSFIFPFETDEQEQQYLDKDLRITELSL